MGVVVKLFHVKRKVFEYYAIKKCTVKGKGEVLQNCFEASND